jgi:hypothetical protein
MVAWVMCARHARNARRVRTPVRTWNPASSPGEDDRPLGRCPCGAAPWDTCSLGEEGVELSPGGAFADHLAHHRGRRSRPPPRRGGLFALPCARHAGERGETSALTTATESEGSTVVWVERNATAAREGTAAFLRQRATLYPQTFRESSATSPTKAGTVSRISREGGVTCSRSYRAVIRPGTFARVISRRRVRAAPKFLSNGRKPLGPCPFRPAQRAQIAYQSVVPTSLDNGRRPPRKVLRAASLDCSGGTRISRVLPVPSPASALRLIDWMVR